MKNLRKYIQGKRYGKEAHQIEFQAMKVPFLEEALEGYDLVDDNHIKSIDRLHNNIQKRFQTSVHIPLKTWTIAASILLCIGLGGFFWKMYRSNINSQVAEAVQPEEKPEPEAVAAKPLYDQPVSPSEIQQATDTLIIYQPKDKEIIAAKLAAILRWKEKRQQLLEQEIASKMSGTESPDVKQAESPKENQTE